MDNLDRQLEAERGVLQRRRDDARARFELAEAEYKAAEAEYQDAEAQIARHLTLVEELLSVRRGGADTSTSPTPDEATPGISIDEGGTTRERIRRFFIRRQRPAAMVDIVDDVRRSGSTARKDTIRGIVYDMVEAGELRKVRRGVYRFLADATKADSTASAPDQLDMSVKEGAEARENEV